MHCFCIVKYTGKAHAVQRFESRWLEKRAQDIAWNSFVMNKVMTINYLYTEVTRRCQRYLFTFIKAFTMKILEMNICMDEKHNGTLWCLRLLFESQKMKNGKNGKTGNMKERANEEIIIEQNIDWKFNVFIWAWYFVVSKFLNKRYTSWNIPNKLLRFIKLR